MFVSKTTAWVGAGILAAMVAAPMAVSAEKSLAAGWRTNTPLGRLISGNVGRLMVLRSELKITDEQREQIGAVLKQHKPKMLEVGKEVWQQRTKLRDAVLAEKPDEAAIRKAADELGKAIGNAAVLGAAIAAEVRPILTAEQIERLQAFRGDRHEAVADFFEEAAAGE